MTGEDVHIHETALVAGFGSSVVDVLMMATESIGLQRKNPIHNQTIQIGGVIPTALVVLSRLGVSTELHTIIGTDMFGESLCTLLNKEGIELKHIMRSETMTTPLACVVIHNDNGQRTSFYTTGEFSHSDDIRVVENINPKATYLIADGHNPQLTHEAIKKAKKHGTKVLLDLGNPKPGLEGLAKESDAIIIPKAYWGTLEEKNPEEIVKNFLSYGIPLVILTMEEHGCLVGSTDGIFHQPSYNVTAIDTNGAGDVFFGTFMYGLVKSWDVSKASQFACAAAARSCTIFGKDKKIPTSEEEVFEFIRTHTVVT